MLVSTSWFDYRLLNRSVGQKLCSRIFGVEGTDLARTHRRTPVLTSRFSEFLDYDEIKANYSFSTTNFSADFLSRLSTVTSLLSVLIYGLISRVDAKNGLDGENSHPLTRSPIEKVRKTTAKPHNVSPYHHRQLSCARRLSKDRRVNARRANNAMPTQLWSMDDSSIRK